MQPAVCAENTCHMEEDEMKPSVQKLKCRFENPKPCLQDSPRVGHVTAQRSEESMPQMASDQSNTDMNDVRKCDRPLPVYSGLSEQLPDPPPPCKSPHSYVNMQSARMPDYVNKPIEPKGPPPVMPRKTSGATTNMVANISPADKKCLLQKVPAPTPRVTKSGKAHSRSGTGGSSSLLTTETKQDCMSLTQHDGNNNSEMANSTKRDSCESKKSDDSAGMLNTDVLCTIM